MFLSLTRACYLYAITDIQEAFLVIPIHPADYRLKGMTWQRQYYFDKCLCAATLLAKHFAHVLQGILLTKFQVEYMSHTVDDFILFGLAQASPVQ